MKKHEAYSLLVRAEQANHGLDLAGVRSLLGFFEPPRIEYDGAFDWVSSVRAKSSDPRKPLRFVFVNKVGLALATDGHSIHMAKTELEAGFYDSQGRKVAETNQATYHTKAYDKVHTIKPDTYLESRVLELECRERDDVYISPCGSEVAAQKIQKALAGSDSLIAIQKNGGSSYWTGINKYGAWVIAGLRV